MKPKSIPALCGHSANRQSSITLSLAVAVLLSGQQAHAANRTWNGGGADTNWSTTANWSAAPVSGQDTLVFAGSTKTTNVNNLTADFTVTGLSFTNTNASGGAAVTGAFTITGNRITLGGNITTTAIGTSPSPATNTDSLGLAMILTGNRTVTTGTSHNLTITGIISEDATSRSLNKAGPATLTLQGANTFTGTLQFNEGTLTLSGANGAANLSSGLIINGGTFNLTNTSALNNTDRLKDSGTVTMNGGTFNFGSNAGAVNYSETTGALSLNAGANAISSGQAVIGQTSALTFTSLARTTGATANFTGTGLGSDSRNRILFGTTAPTLSNGIIGSWATVNSTDWASYDGTNGVIALAPASYTNDTWAAGNHTTVTTSSAPATASETGTLRFNLASPATVTLDGVNTISSGGILVASTVVANATTITGGTLQGPAGGELVIHQHNNNAAGGLTIGSIIQDNTGASSLVKSGAGTLTLTGVNTYTGGTVINAGSLILINAGSGETLQGPITLGGSARLVLGKSNQISDASILSFASGNNSARFVLTNAAGAGYNETIGGITDAAGTFSGSRVVESASDGVSSSPATLTINTATGQTYNFGGLVRNAAGTLSPVGSSNLSIVKDGLGTQEFSGSVSYSGATTVKAGTLKLSATNSVINNSAISLEGGTIEFAGGGTRSLAITSTVSTGGVTKSGTGTLSLTGDNTYTGETKVTNGTLQLNRAGGTIADTGTVSVTSDTAILDVAQNDTIANLNIALGATVSGVGTLTVTTAIAPNIAINKTNTISASLAGTAQLKKTGQGTTILSGANSYSGGTWLTGTNSKLTISGSGTLGSTSGALLIDTTGTILDLGTTSQTVGAVTLTAGTIQNGTLTGSSYDTAAGTVSAVLAGSGAALTKTTTGTLTLSGPNTYGGGTNVNNGALTFLYTTSQPAAGTTIVASGATLGLGVGGATTPFTSGNVDSLFAGTLANVTNSTTSIVGMDTTNGNFTYATSASSTTRGLSKLGANTLTLSGTNAYTGPTSINSGTLALASTGSISSSSGITISNGATYDVSAVSGYTVGSAQTLAGGGNVTGATIIAGTHSPGVAGVSNGVGTQTFSSTLNYATGSIFEWDLNATPGVTGVVADAATGTYDKVVATGAITGGSAIFKVVLSGNTFADDFWNTDKSWTNIFSGAGTPANLAAVFSSFSATGGLDTGGLVSGRGQFTFNSSTSTLNWSAVPEPTSTLAGLLIGAGLLRRRRSA